MVGVSICDLASRKEDICIAYRLRAVEIGTRARSMVETRIQERTIE